MRIFQKRTLMARLIPLLICFTPFLALANIYLQTYYIANDASANCSEHNCRGKMFAILFFRLCLTTTSILSQQTEEPAIARFWIFVNRSESGLAVCDR
jgi:hypothetical protein